MEEVRVVEARAEVMTAVAMAVGMAAEAKEAVRVAEVTVAEVKVESGGMATKREQEPREPCRHEGASHKPRCDHKPLSSGAI